MHFSFQKTYHKKDLFEHFISAVKHIKRIKDGILQYTLLNIVFHPVHVTVLRLKKNELSQKENGFHLHPFSEGLKHPCYFGGWCDFHLKYIWMPLRSLLFLYSFKYVNQHFFHRLIINIFSVCFNSIFNKQKNRKPWFIWPVHIL